MNRVTTILKLFVELNKLSAAIDTAILVDIFKGDAAFGENSRKLVNRYYRQGALLISEVVYAEIAPLFSRQKQLDEILLSLNVTVSPLTCEAAFLAGQTWKNYRERGGSRQRIMSDFLIGAHASIHTDILLTRDLAFYRTNFSKLDLDDGQGS